MSQICLLKLKTKTGNNYKKYLSNPAGIISNLTGFKMASGSRNNNGKQFPPTPE